MRITADVSKISKTIQPDLTFILNVLVFCFCFYFFFCLGFLSRTFMIHRIAGEEEGYFINSPVPLAPASQTLARRLQQRGHLCTELAAGLEPETLGFRAQVANTNLCPLSFRIQHLFCLVLIVHAKNNVGSFT